MSAFVIVIIGTLLLTCVGLTALLIAVCILLLRRSKITPPLSMNQKADHFAFQVSDLNRSISFYTNQLNLKLLDSHQDEEQHEAFAFFELQGGNLELLQMLDKYNRPILFKQKENKTSFSPHFAIQTDNLEMQTRRLSEEKIPIVKGPLEIPGKVKWLYIQDPDMNIIEYVQWL